MRPENTRVWRKQQRDADKGTATGRRTTHRVETQKPSPRSTWARRHRQALPMSAYLNPSDGA